MGGGGILDILEYKQCNETVFIITQQAQLRLVALSG